MEILLPNQTFLTIDIQLQEVVLKITDSISVDRIYFCQFEYKEMNFAELIILIPNSAKQHLTEAKPLAKMILSKYPNYKFRMFYLYEARDALKQGSMTFFNICRPENLIFRQAESPIDLIIEELDYKTVHKCTTDKFKKELKKIADFREGAEFYLEQKNYPLAALMLHQSIELSYRAAEIMIVGKERASHCIRNHQKYLSHYAPEFSLVFNEQEEEDMKLVDLLNEAYVEVRYENTYKISTDQLDFFIKKADSLNMLVKELYDLVTEDFTKNIPKNKKTNTPKSKDMEITLTKGITMENSTASSSTIEKIIKEITSLIAVERIYCIGETNRAFLQKGIFKTGCNASQHFDLLVITEKPCSNDDLNIQSNINQNKDIDASVMLLVHSVKNINDALLDGNSIFNTILDAAELLYQKDGASEFISPPDYDTSNESGKRLNIWNKRKNRAEALINFTLSAPYEEEIVEAFLLNQAMEQICKGFIFYYLGYIPNQQSLRHLFNICRYIDPAVNEIFPITRDDDREIFNTLVNAPKDMRHSISSTVDQTDLGILYRRCRAWLGKADELITKELN